MGVSIGSVDGIDHAHLARVRELIDDLNPMLVSGHLAWSTHQGAYLNDLLPLPYDEETLQLVSSHLHQVQDTLRRPYLVENPSSYVGFGTSTMTEVEFLGELARRTGCGLLCDVSNVFLSGHNMGYDPYRYIDAFPSGAVKELHLGGFAAEDDQATPDGTQILIDTHGAAIAEPVWQLYTRLPANVPGFPSTLAWGLLRARPENSHQSCRVPQSPPVMHEIGMAGDLLRPGWGIPMKLSVIALDYDGTITRGDTLEPTVREAIGLARTNGIVILLVTGRTLGELQRVAGPLHFVDGVVAENGAVTYFPDSGHLSTHAPLVPDTFVQELRRRQIPHQVGRCLVDADANEAPRILDVIRGLELPLVLAFNGGRVMTMAQGISKATGLHTALDTLRLSARNTLAIGDRENDHELLRLAEVGVAVGWGSAALRGIADVVIDGAGPAAVARYIRVLAASQQLPVPARPRRRLRLGYTEDGLEFSLAVRGRNVLIAGDAKSGKSWIAGLLCEQLILHGYSTCILDPEGDYRSLEALPGVTALGGEDPPPTPRELLRALRYPDRSVVIDLSHRSHDEKIEYIRAVLPALNEIRRHTGLPHRIVLDEAHYYLHDADVSRLLDFERNGYTIVTYWASRLPQELMAKTEVMISTHESSPAEVDALRKWCSTCQPVDPSRWSILGRLATRQAVALPITEEAGGDLRVFTFGTRLTPHVRHREKYVDVPVAESRAFFFALNGRPAGHGAQTLRQFVKELKSATTATLEGHLRRGDFSRWIEDVFGDFALGARLRALEQDYAATHRPDIVSDMVAAIRERYDLKDGQLLAVS